MVQIQWAPVIFGALMASIDVSMLSLVNIVRKSQGKLIRWMIIPTIVYMLQPWLFLSSLQYEGLIVMNLMWDLISDVLVTATGFLFFKETIGPYKTLGVILSFVSITLMSIQDGSWEDFLGQK